MSQIPDAPWIRDAEINGMPYDEKPVVCPFCGAEWPEYIFRIGNGGEAIGCSECVEQIAAEDWEDERNHQTV